MNHPLYAEGAVSVTEVQPPGMAPLLEFWSEHGALDREEVGRLRDALDQWLGERQAHVAPDARGRLQVCRCSLGRNHT